MALIVRGNRLIDQQRALGRYLTDAELASKSAHDDHCECEACKRWLFGISFEAGELLPTSKPIAKADVDEIMMEQIQMLIAHVAGGQCGCEQCDRFRRVRAILVYELFPEAMVAKAAGA